MKNIKDQISGDDAKCFRVIKLDKQSTFFGLFFSFFLVSLFFGGGEC
jgi:hypothetical protein